MARCRGIAVVFLCILFLTESSSRKASKERPVREDPDVFEESSLRLDLEHAFGDGQEFTTRGTVSVRSLKTSYSSVAFLQEPLTNQQLQNLKTAARNGENYFIRTRSRLTDIHGNDDVEDGGNTVFVSTLISACSLVKSRLSDIITISGDGKGNVIGLAITTPLVHDGKMGCEETEVHLPHNFNTSISLDNGTPGPVPDTQSYLQKLEKEERENKEGKDNRSFLQKYWIYIVIGVLVVSMLSGGGGGGAAGGQGGGGGGGGGQ